MISWPEACPQPDLEGPDGLALANDRYVLELRDAGEARRGFGDGRGCGAVGDDDGVLAGVGRGIPPVVVLRRQMVEGGDADVVQLEAELGGIVVACSGEEAARMRRLLRFDPSGELGPADARGGAGVAAAEELGRTDGVVHH